ncbi:hypothetical protein Tco_0873836 [Tanacetum coccineum]|uniref:Retrovirus-related Pol polyprotein from transposon TNT 1-94 n=1 Tax=Tanacetum coccineum TaxID=301880 RepID=A0ABQ5BJX5_9ASTR
MDGCDSISTPMATARLDADLQGTPIDQTKYQSMIVGLMYLSSSRPDIAFSTFVYARYQARPIDYGFELIAYSDVDHAGCHDDCKSTLGGLQILGENLVSWSSKKQDCTVLSIAEAEYVSLSASCTQVIWMQTQLLDYRYKFNKILMYCDSKSAIAISCNPVQHSRSKHINIRYHFIKEHVERGTVELYFFGIKYQLVDLFTIALPKECFEYLVHRIGFAAVLAVLITEASQSRQHGFAAVLAVRITEASQSRQHVDTSLIHIESRKSPTKSLFDVGSSRISIFTELIEQRFAAIKGYRRRCGVCFEIGLLFLVSFASLLFLRLLSTS